jgi:hypothetical protein
MCMCIAALVISIKTYKQPDVPYEVSRYTNCIHLDRAILLSSDSRADTELGKGRESC